MLLLAGCEPANVVDCRPGTFARAEGDSWCLYGGADSTRCPPQVRIEHRLPWGGRGCATRMHDPVPSSELCVAVNRCPTDAGIDARVPMPDAGRDGGADSGSDAGTDAGP
jgi:hypothetical protein